MVPAWNSHLDGFDAAVVDTLLHIREHKSLGLSIGVGSGRVAGPYLKKRKSPARLVADLGDDNVARRSRYPGIEAQTQLSQWFLLTTSSLYDFVINSI